MYNSLSEQIKRYKNEIADMSGIKKYDANRIQLLNLLKKLVENKSELTYLVSPIELLLQDMKEGISKSLASIPPDDQVIILTHNPPSHIGIFIFMINK